MLRMLPVLLIIALWLAACSEEQPRARDEAFDVPSLTAQETARAAEILATDPRAIALLNGEDYTIEDVTPVIDSESGADGLVGVSMLISLDQPMSVEGSWLMKHDAGPGDPQGSGPKEVLVNFPGCAAPNGVRELLVSVDLTNDKLVQLEPLGVPGFDVGTSYCR